MGIISSGELIGEGTVINAENNIEITAKTINFYTEFNKYYNMQYKEKKKLDVASAVAFVGTAVLTGGTSLGFAAGVMLSAMQMKKKKASYHSSYDEKSVNNEIVAKNITFNSENEIHLANTILSGNVDTNTDIYKTVWGEVHEREDKTVKSGGKWWKAGVAGFLVGFASSTIKAGTTIDKMDAISSNYLGNETGSDVLSKLNNVLSLFGEKLEAESLLGAFTELFGSSLIESTIIKPTLGVYNE